MTVDLPETSVGYDRDVMSSPYSDVIRNERLRLGWSQRTLARHAGVTPGYVALLEKGTRAPGDDLWARLQRLLGVTEASNAATQIATVFGSFQTSALADLLSATREIEMDLPLPEETDWFERVPFTTVVGGLGSGKTTFVGRWLARVGETTGRQIVWVQLTPTSSPQAVESQILAQTSPEGAPLPSSGSRSIGALALAVTRHLEESRRVPVILCFDDWDSSIGGAHTLVPELAAILQRTPVIATTENARSSVGGATVRPVPKPTEADWQGWCDAWLVPHSIRSDFLNRVHHNVLAASMLRGAVFFSSEAGNTTALESTWHQIVTDLPAQTEFAWSSVVQECLNRVGEIANRVLHLAASATEPVPRTWLGDDANTADTSKLVQYRLARTVQWKGLSSVAVHPVMRTFSPAIEYGQFSGLSQAPAEPALVELLLNLGMFDEAANVISVLVEQWLPTSEVPANLIELVDRLPAGFAGRFPTVLFGLVRALALRAEAGDLKRAAASVEELLTLPLTEGQQWQLLRLGADVAIRSLDYTQAIVYIEAADRLFERSAGSFDAQALAVLRARIHWEQCEFEDAREVLGSGGASDHVEDARHSSWLARASAALGDYATAARAVNRGIELSRRSRSLRPEAYNAVLLAEYELVRGNLSRARRLAERSSHIADERGLSNLHAQALGVQAEIASAQGEAKEADRLLEMAINAVTQRGDDAWANAYLLLVQARLARFQPRWPQLWSLAQSLENEAIALGERAEHHPVVGALLIESAHCWTASGYSHRARQLLDMLSQRRVDWRTSCEMQLVDLVTRPECGDEERHQGVAALIQRARDAGAPYLAATWAYLASTYRLVTGDESTAETYGAWVAEVAEARGWPVLASKARALAPRSELPIERGHLVQHSDGTTTLVAPRRRQRSSRTDPEVPLPDPFDE